MSKSFTKAKSTEPHTAFPTPTPKPLRIRRQNKLKKAKLSHFLSYFLLLPGRQLSRIPAKNNPSPPFPQSNLPGWEFENILPGLGFPVTRWAAR